MIFKNQPQVAVICTLYLARPHIINKTINFPKCHTQQLKKTLSIVCLVHMYKRNRWIWLTYFYGGGGTGLFLYSLTRELWYICFWRHYVSEVRRTIILKLQENVESICFKVGQIILPCSYNLRKEYSKTQSVKTSLDIIWEKRERKKSPTFTSGSSLYIDQESLTYKKWR